MDDGLRGYGEWDISEKQKPPPAGMSATLVELASELGQYIPLFGIVSVLGAYIYNNVFFHNVDGELYYQPFMSLLTFNDYLSTSFHFIPPIALIFIGAVFFVQAITVLIWRSVRLANLLAPLVRPLRKIRVLDWLLVNPKRLGYMLSIMLLLLPTGFASLTADRMQPRYNFGILFIALTYLVLFFLRKNPWISQDGQVRRLYVYLITTATVVALSAVMGNYRFEMALDTSQKTLAMGPVGGRYDAESDRVTAARTLEKGIFYIRKDVPGQSVAYFEPYEGGPQLANPIRPLRRGRLYQRVGCWVRLSACY